MSTKKTFTYVDGTGSALTGRLVRAKDQAGLLSDVDGVELGHGAYRFILPNGLWSVWDITSGTPGVDTGHVLDVAAVSSSEPAISGSTRGKFWDGTKEFREVEVADVSGLQVALDAETSARESSVSSEASAREAGDAALDAAIDAISAKLWAKMPTAIKVGTTSDSATVAAMNGSTARIVAFSGGYHVVGKVVIPSGFATGGICVILESAGLPVPANDGAAGCWSSQNLPENGPTVYRSGGIEIVSISASVLKVRFCGMEWDGVHYPGQAIRFTFDILEF